MQSHKEAVELILWQCVSAFEVVGVLGGEEHEGLFECAHNAVGRDRRLVHGLKKCGLGSGGCAVDLISQHEVGENRPGLEDKLGLLAVEDGDPKDITGEQVGGELDSGEGAVHALGQRGGEHSFTHPGHILDQGVAPGEEAADQSVHGIDGPQVDLGDVLSESLNGVEHGAWLEAGTEWGSCESTWAVGVRLLYREGCPFAVWHLVERPHRGEWIPYGMWPV